MVFTKLLSRYLAGLKTTTNVYPQAEEVYKRASWTESFVQWSPHGNYLATVHRQGVVIWGGASWQRLARFSHPGVRTSFVVMIRAWVRVYYGASWQLFSRSAPTPSLVQGIMMDRVRVYARRLLAALRTVTCSGWAACLGLDQGLTRSFDSGSGVHLAKSSHHSGRCFHTYCAHHVRCHVVQRILV